MEHVEPKMARRRGSDAERVELDLEADDHRRCRKIVHDFISCL